VRIATITSGGERQTRGLLERAGLAERVEALVTMDEARANKLPPEPYLRADERLGFEMGGLVLIAAHRWDLVGARAAGLQAVWIDRLAKRWPFPLDEPPRAAGSVEAAELALAGIA
jgi:2-haloacid dehalogenase